ncbi:terminase small subunit [Deinococcus ruber]|uniref:Terminase small subunit n=1 Tax=Deinococcus ruber TaxID=1848197 RepID=A0A918C078_9DEIO|nr:terminase small subunit [Deinococcus ruber]GGR00212.1 hypothetical protein GCM10008957_11190 [Deinococcus ruber]
MPDESAVPEGAALPKLSDKHAKFVRLYLGECNLNASKAARKAGYQNHAEGYRLLQREDVAAHVRAGLESEAQVMPAGEVMRRLSTLARQDADMADFVKVSNAVRTFWLDYRKHEPVHELAKKHGCDIDDLDAEDLMREFGADAVATTLDGDTMIRINSLETDVTIDWTAAVEAGALSAIQVLKKNKDGSIEYKLKDTVRALELLGKKYSLFTDRQEISGSVDLGVKYIAGLSEDDL